MLSAGELLSVGMLGGQRCTNFKDRGVLVYGGELFQEQRDRADDIFTAMPPPVPSRSAAAGADTSSTAAVTMAAYNNVDNPCVPPRSASSCTLRWPALCSALQECYARARATSECRGMCCAS